LLGAAGGWGRAQKEENLKSNCGVMILEIKEKNEKK